MKQMIEEMSQEFMTHLFPFWEGMIDRRWGGYYGKMDFDLVLHKDADKGCILNSRILWTFSTAFLVLKDPIFLSYAKQAYDFMQRAFLDRSRGGVYWSVTSEGLPSDEQKHTYNLAFAIYGLSAYYDATKDEHALRCARDLMAVIEEKCRDKEGYLESFDVSFGPYPNDRLSENGVMADRTMNTLLHVMEAYTELHRVSPSKQTEEKIKEILLLFKNKIFNPEKGRLEVFFDRDYKTLIDLHSYGHDIEASWLIDRAVSVIGAEGTDYDLSSITKTLMEKIYTEAYDGHSVPAECEEGRVLTDRIWWVQCEAVIGFINGYERTGEDKFLEASKQIWEYIGEHIVDRRKGSCWYAQVLKDGTPDPAKAIADEWTCPYHNGRMYFEVLKRLGRGEKSNGNPKNETGFQGDGLGREALAR
ncbi:MAG: AGE family epimerase/isomerase [Lachnospiraceae bacterium]|nr:AGE family epimerase/isomerase [Lachnospiraceae bacterium]